MSSPTSSSSASSLSIANDAQQSTKERRRERNRLAAQKHRLRRSQRMSQLEQQVQSLQQEKHILLSHLDASKATTVTSPSNFSSYDAASDSDMTDRDDGHRASETAHKRARTTPSNHGVHGVRDKSNPESLIDSYESRILELEKWTETLNGSLRDALDSEAHLKAELQSRFSCADAKFRHSSDALVASQNENAALKRTISRLQNALDSLAAEERCSERMYEDDESHTVLGLALSSKEDRIKELQARYLDLKEMLESCEITLELQRRENEVLRRRLEELNATSATCNKSIDCRDLGVPSNTSIHFHDSSTQFIGTNGVHKSLYNYPDGKRAEANARSIAFLVDQPDIRETRDKINS